MLRKSRKFAFMRARRSWPPADTASARCERPSLSLPALLVLRCFKAYLLVSGAFPLASACSLCLAHESNSSGSPPQGKPCSSEPCVRCLPYPRSVRSAVLDKKPRALDVAATALLVNIAELCVRELENKWALSSPDCRLMLRPVAAYHAAVLMVDTHTPGWPILLATSAAAKSLGVPHHWLVAGPLEHPPALCPGIVATPWRSKGTFVCETPQPFSEATCLVGLLAHPACRVSR